MELVGVEPTSSGFSVQCTDRLYDSSKMRVVGFEPTTDGLKARYSTTELHPRKAATRTRTGNLLLTRQLHHQLCYNSKYSQIKHFRKMGPIGIEPISSGFSDRRTDLLCYSPEVRGVGFEPHDPRVKSPLLYR